MNRTKGQMLIRRAILLLSTMLVYGLRGFCMVFRIDWGSALIVGSRRISNLPDTRYLPPFCDGSFANGRS